MISAENDFPWQVKINESNVALALELEGGKKPVLQGDNGLSQKSEEPGNASYYYSMTRMPTMGTITLEGTSYRVVGESWLDREWGTSALSENQSGWDWFSLQFNHGKNAGQELMYYQLRDLQGNADVNSRGSWIDQSGNSVAILPGDIRLEEIEQWRSESGTQYTTLWRMTYADQSYRVKAVFEDQLMDVTFRYWEGAVDIIVESSGERVGQGYLEMVR